MKPLLTLALFLMSFAAPAQIINRNYHQTENAYNFNQQQPGISAGGTTINIKVKVVYNAVPDGYLVTFTTTFIGKTVEEVETTMNDKVELLMKDLKPLKIKPDEVLIDIISLDPIFGIYEKSTTESIVPEPEGYKITQNITFNLKHIDQFRKLSVVCMEHDIYDVINTQAYLDSSKEIYDSLATKAVEVLNHKKQLASNIGWSFADGKIDFTKHKDVLYPSERYLKSHLRNNRLYMHDLSQNSAVDVQRQVDVDNYYTLDLKDADFVFHASETNPVIQFYYAINYNHVKKDTEAQLRKKIRKEVEEERSKTFYLLDKNGRLKEIDLE